MPTNEFLPFATGGGSAGNLESQAAFAADPTVATGEVPGIANPLRANKLWRQASFITSTIAKTMMDILGVNVSDDGNQAGFEQNFYDALLTVGSAVLTDTGGVNHLILAPPIALPAPASIPDGAKLWVKPNHTNTAAVDFAVSGGTASPVTDPVGGVLPPGTLIVGYPVLLLKQGGGSPTWILVKNTAPLSAAMAPVAGGYYGLVGSTTVGTKLGSWTVKETYAETGFGGYGYKGWNLALSFNGAGTGVNGMDTGGMPNGADLSIYEIYNPTTNTWGTLGYAGSSQYALTYPGGFMPAGYVASRLLWAGVTSGTNFVQTNQYGTEIFISSSNVLTNGNTTTPTSVTMTSVVPAAAISIGGNWSYSSVAGTAFIGGTAGSGTGGTGMVGFQWMGGTGTGGLQNFNNVPMVTPQTFYYYSSVGGLLVSVAVDSYKI
jgi:hypothetical protein